MQKIEGILLSKTPYGDKHIISNLLLRNGEQVALMFYGAQAGKKTKTSQLEIGSVFKIDLQHKNSNSSEMYIVKEWIATWVPRAIRENHDSFFLASFYLELLKKIAIKTELQVGNLEHEGLFRVGSNALFYLEESLQKKVFEKQTHLTLFLVKLIFESGVIPQLEHCLFCERELSHQEKLHFDRKEGGFICTYCQTSASVKEAQVYRFFKRAITLKYTDYEKMQNSENHINQELMDYLCYQLRFSLQDFKTLPMLFT
ncbi:MAG: DNA repair protein RecO C-terminal domain-containing protein [Bacteriovoracaceae bacterium]|nr:DNA repair protein RecO C-terminal domain-containing protein [Bacteriovoracaceae bacterium]